MSAERLYRLLLRAYPTEFRAKFGKEMVLVFRDQCRDGDVRSPGFWARVVWDVLRSAPALRAEATSMLEVIMKIAAVLALVLGAFTIFGAITEWMAASQHAGVYATSVVLVVVGNFLLLGAGIAMLRGVRQRVRPVVIASLVCFAAARLLFPWMGIFLQLVGFGLPVALLITLYWPRKSSTLGTA